MDEKTPQNLGLLIDNNPNPKDFVLGMTSNLTHEILRPSMDYADILPEFEPQSFPGFDTMSCVTFAALNCLEILMRVKYNKEVNFSDRFTAVRSNTQPRGNYLATVAESIRTQGVIPEEDYPYMPNLKKWDDYHKKPLPVNLVTKALQWKDEWAFGWEWTGTDPETLRAVLKMSPCSVTVQVGHQKNSQGYYEYVPGRGYGHAVALVAVRADHFEIYDHYANKHKKLAIDYRFGSSMRYSLKTTKNMPKEPSVKLPNDCLVFVKDVNTKRIFLSYMLRDNTMIIDKREKIDDAWKARNAGTGFFKNAACRTITREQWDEFKKANFKGDDLNGLEPEELEALLIENNL